jgi:hypothetical protein
MTLPYPKVQCLYSNHYSQGEFFMALNPLRSLLTPEQIKAEEALNIKFTSEQLQKLAKQWSQLVVWSWLEPTDYPQPPSDNEEKLRQKFIEIVKELAHVNIRGLYEEELGNSNPNPLEEASEDLSKLLRGETQVASLALPELYNNLTGQKPTSSDYIFNRTIQTKIFTDYFVWGILIDRFTGVCVDYLADKDKFVVLLAYPSRPALSPSFLTLKELQEWIADKGSGYLHPNPYIPTCNC